jgi:hypothetical protein
MNNMRIPSLLAVALCALLAPAAGSAALPDPAPASAPRRVAAPCQFASATLSLSSEESPGQGRGYSIQVANNSKRILAMPSSPALGWRVDTLVKNTWKLKAEGGPVRLLTTSGRSDPHMAVTGQSASGPMVQIPPTHAHDFDFFLPDAEPALRLDPGLKEATFKLTVYWAAPADLAQSNPDVPACALSGDWVVKMQAP